MHLFRTLCYAAIATLLAFGSFLHTARAADTPRRVRVLIIDGQNNHDWRVTTNALRATLERTGVFDVTVSTAPQPTAYRPPREPKTDDPRLKKAYDETVAAYKELTHDAGNAFGAAWEKWNPDFKQYDAVLLNYNGRSFPKPMADAFVDYVRNGGGLVLVHAANNGFRDWDEFNEMIGLGWRPAGFGKALKIDPDTGKTIEANADQSSGHGSRHPFVMTVRQPEHPIMRGVPAQWMHGTDELYHNMRGPATHVTILSSAYSDPKQRGTGLHEPITWESRFGKGSVIVTSMGHFWRGQDNWDSLYCVGFQTILARSVQYVATGGVTLDVPKGFPGSDAVSIVPPGELTWTAGGQVTSPSPVVDESWRTIKEKNFATMLTARQESATFELADGFVAEPMATEPQVQEPVVAVWDGNGAMYVAEMRSYMQDEAGTGTKTLRNGRVKRLEDTDGDGVMDRVTTFIDNLNLPRMLLPLDDRLAVVETDSLDVWSYRDTNGDGVADEKIKLYDGSEDRPDHSVEHQNSGLIWNLDNWIYISYGQQRFRFTDGTWKAESLHGNWAQWGLDHDDVGRVFYSANSEPVKSIQLPRQYWSLIQKRTGERPASGEPLDFGKPYAPEFAKAKNLCPVDDRGGSTPPFKGFTSTCGQSVFRGDALPIDVRGNYFVCDPTIHVVRRAIIEDRNGSLYLTNPYGDNEFLVSPDINFRPVNTMTGPDGCLYVVDMYRGIIQDSPWLSPGPRKFIRESGLADNNQHGRIWRIRHRDFAPGERPHMLNESTVELLRHLQNPNGWWRDTAQRLIILRKDRDNVVPLLEGMVRFDDNPLTRLHALWTLEGIGDLKRDLLRDAMTDRDPRIRAAAVHVLEPLVVADAEGALDDLAKIADDRDPEVAKQLILTLGTSPNAKAPEMIDAITARHLNHDGVRLARLVTLWKVESPLIRHIQDGSAMAAIKDPTQRFNATRLWLEGIANWSRGLNLPKDMPKEQKQLLKSGEQTFYNHCVACHGADGKGMDVPGLPMPLAPALAGSKRVKGPPENLIPVLINGLVGPIDGKTYSAGMMVPAAALDVTRDDRLAEVISFIRYAWGNEAEAITKEQVTEYRKRYGSRSTPWTSDELEAEAAKVKATQ
ncbi:MAG: hypothetical protein GC159_23265 [Phycisphaera sp.]|nr:hypothetical protein [Phycisphaera sp.]